MSTDSTQTGAATPDLKPMSMGEIIDQSFKAYRRAWKPLALVAIIPLVPAVLSSGTMMSAMPVNDPNDIENNLIVQLGMRASQGDWTGIIALFSAVFLLLLISLFLYPIAYGAQAAICSHTILGRPIGAREALQIAARRYFSLLGTGLLSILLYLVAFPVLVIGGLVILSPLTLMAGYIAMTVYLVFTLHAVVVESTAGGVPAMKRSFELVKGRFWPLLGLGVLFTLLVSIVGGILSLFTALPMQLLPTFVFQSVVSAWILVLLQSLPSLLTGPFTIMGMTMAYYDTRMRKEGFDLELKAAAQAPETEPQ